MPAIFLWPLPGINPWPTFYSSDGLKVQRYERLQSLLLLDDANATGYRQYVIPEKRFTEKR